MKREDVSKIFEGATDEQINALLNINSSDIGKAKGDFDKIKGELEALKSEKKTLEDKVKELGEKSTTADDYKNQLEALQKQIKEKEEADRAAQADAELTNAITAVFGDKKFTSDYVKNGIITDMKAEIAKPENKGKGYAEIFEGLTKDKDGIFANANPPGDMSGMGKTDTDISENTMRAIMGLAPNKE